MKIEIIRVSRRPPWPIWAVLLVLLWLGLGGTTILLAEFLGRPVQLCLFKRLTGIACPTCGFTRGAMNLLQGRVVKAWPYNPLLYSALVLFAGFILLRLIFGRTIRIDMSRTERMIVWILAVGLFFANWAYVIVYVG
jgi:hypothetical protein